jgi:hypothetical protein
MAIGDKSSTAVIDIAPAALLALAAVTIVNSGPALIVRVLTVGTEKRSAVSD